MADPKKEKLKKKKATLEVCTDSLLVCPVCGEEHEVYKAKRAFYIAHIEGDKRIVAKIYIRKRMPKIPKKEEKAEE